MPPQSKKPAAASSGNGMKQGTLFSFFTKKPKDTTTTTTAALAKSNKTNGASTNASSASASEKSASVDTSASNNSSHKSKSHIEAAAKTTGPPSKPMTKSSNDKVSKIKMGMKIAVFWPDDKQYYPAVVTKERKDRSSFYLEYEDGECEWIDLRQEKFRFVEDEDVMEDDDDDEEEEEELNQGNEKQRPKKRPRIQEDSDEEEYEMDDVPSESEESAFEDQEAEEEHDDDQWLVSDDEDDDKIVEGSTKRKASGKLKKAKARKVTKHNATPSSSSSIQSATKTTPKTTPNKSSATPTASSTPKSLASFSAFSNTQINAPKRVTPPSSNRSTSTSPLIDAENSVGALPYVQGVVNPAGSHVHNHLKFIKHPRDAQGRPENHPDYDPRTLKIDSKELERHNNGKKWSPGVQQWWECKVQYFDTVLLFKTGKFYEMYHMDADIGVKVCGLTYMKGHVAHAGFPEISYGEMAEKLCRAGYKVARVEQTETPEMHKERKKKSRGSKISNALCREVCSILTMGTRTYCYLDHQQLESDGANASAETGPLLAIREIQLEDSAPNQEGSEEASMRPVCEYGITVVDAARAVITLGQFADDVLRSRMTTLLAAFTPSEVLIEGGENGASQTLHSLLKTAQTTSPHPFRIEYIRRTESFPKSTAVDPEVKRKLERNNGRAHPWDVKETLQELHRREYFPRGSRQEKGSSSTSRWPKVLRAVVEGEAELALSSLGAALYYLQRNLIDEEIMTMGIVKAYVPPVTESTKLGEFGDDRETMEIETTNPAEGQGGSSASNTRTSPHELERVESVNQEDQITHMSIDGDTLCQLELLTNSIDHKVDGSLWSKIKFTKTPHGSRLLRAWLLRPLFRKADIERRADAVEELATGDSSMALNEAHQCLAKCGDIERLLAKLHSMGGNQILGEDEGTSFSSNHPNSRAILYEAKTHTKRKLGDFSKVLNGLKHVSRIPEIFSNVDIQSGLLKKIVRFQKDGGCFPEISDRIDEFFSMFDFEEAATGNFEPGRGIDPEFDQALDAVDQIKAELENYRDEMINNLQPRHLAQSWKYVNTGKDSKDKYTIELPASVKVPNDFRMTGKRGKGTKQVNKYQAHAVEQLVVSLEQAFAILEERKAIQMQLIFAKFDALRTVWAAVAHATAFLDALGSLAQLASRPGYCRPNILDCPPDKSPCIRIEQGRHPCIENTPTSGEFVPNNLKLGGSGSGESEMVLLLSGPNMGGKSTLLRQTCLIYILAQIGGFVPAESCDLTPIDKVFTRLGASDRILLGQSTFFVELAETAAALRGASRRSLVLFDELGRGTSSFDGTAIASACLSYICSNLKCLALFATHYHSLLNEWKHDSKVRLGHMESVVNDDDNDDQDNITFLYTLGKGACPKSFGVNVARLARLPEEVLNNAQRISIEFEEEMNMTGSSSKIAPNKAVEQKHYITELIREGKVGDIEALWEELQKH